MMSLPKEYKSFVNSNFYKDNPLPKLEKVYANNKGEKLINSISEVFDKLAIKDGMTLSFHHHLRNGDYVLNLVLEEIKNRNLKNITLAPSSIFPVHNSLCELIENKNVTNIYTNYLNGEVANTINAGHLEGLLIMDTHGGRSVAIESGNIKIDVAFIACPTTDKLGNGHGRSGKSACGSLGYAIPDMYYAKNKVLITDNLVDEVVDPEIKAEFIDYIVAIDSIGDKDRIVSGTTKITKDPIGLRIADETAKLIDALGLIKNGFSMQTGAGGTSLAVSDYVKKIMIEKNIKAAFASGGITGYFVNMLEENLVDELFDVQCFDLSAVESIDRNKKHHSISAFKYANPYHDPIVNKLDFVILGATEIDLNFNVNVTTGSNGIIMGGSGGHADTAHGANVSIIVSPLIKSRIPIIKDRVTTITTPGEDIDIFVTERGIAINPKRTDLIEKLKNSKIKLKTIAELYEEAHLITSVPKKIIRSDKIIGLVRYRDMTIIDCIYKKEE